MDQKVNLFPYSTYYLDAKNTTQKLLFTLPKSRCLKKWLMMIKLKQKSSKKNQRRNGEKLMNSKKKNKNSKKKLHKAKSTYKMYQSFLNLLQKVNQTIRKRNR